MKAEIVNAIDEQRTLELLYHGYVRVVEPHAYGRDKTGDEVLRCFQVAGGSESGERTGWKLLKLADAYAIHELKNNFQPRPEYRRGDKAMEYIFRQL
ncbi:MAG: hypothetical protein AB7O31_15910 [Burkholderiales bacterium]